MILDRLGATAPSWHCRCPQGAGGGSQGLHPTGPSCLGLPGRGQRSWLPVPACPSQGRRRTTSCGRRDGKRGQEGNGVVQTGVEVVRELGLCPWFLPSWTQAWSCPRAAQGALPPLAAHSTRGAPSTVSDPWRYCATVLLVPCRQREFGHS